MIDIENCTLEQLSAHQVGNKTNGEELYLSKELVDDTTGKHETLLLHYFLKSFTNPEFHNLTFTNGNHKLNPLFNFASNIFSNPNTFHENSVYIAQHLYQVSEHPNIKAGDLFIAELTGIQLGEFSVDAIGIFKSENKNTFIKLERSQESCSIQYNEGINIEKLDKGCLIFNIDQENGYKVCIVDKSNRADEAHYWKDSFLNLKPCSDEYHKTKDFLNITRQYVTNQLTEEFEVAKTDKIDLLNRSVAYFKENDSFQKQEFEEHVFQQPELIDSFRKFDDNYREEMDLTPTEDNFAISNQAVKNQARIFKSVLKLDKNFHIYIHGNKSLIEKGTETDGRKYYKIYYNEEK